MLHKCKKCGNCCRLVDLLMPEFDRGDGVCINLTEDNLCCIYPIRPDNCRANQDEDNEESCKIIAEEIKKRTLEGRYVKTVLGNNKK